MSGWIGTIFLVVLLNAAVGTAAYFLCRVLTAAAGRSGWMRVIYPMYKSVLLFYVLPGILCCGWIHRHISGVLFSLAIPARITTYAIYAVWILGTAATLAVYVRKYRIFLRFRSRNYPMDDERAARMLAECFPDRDWNRVGLSVNDLLKSPCVMGLIRQEIALPDAEYTDEELRTILMHEAMHIVKKDNPVKRIALALVVVYWFALPMRRYVTEMDEWAETACDISVCRKFFGGRKKRYFQILYGVYLKGSVLMPRPVVRCSRSDSLRRRIERIGKWNGK